MVRTRGGSSNQSSRRSSGRLRNQAYERAASERAAVLIETPIPLRTIFTVSSSSSSSSSRTLSEIRMARRLGWTQLADDPVISSSPNHSVPQPSPTHSLNSIPQPPPEHSPTFVSPLAPAPSPQWSPPPYCPPRVSPSHTPEPAPSPLKRKARPTSVASTRKSPRVPPSDPATAQPASKRQKVHHISETAGATSAKGKASKEGYKKKEAVKTSESSKNKDKFDGQVFCSEAASKRYTTIKLKSFVKERRVALKADEYVDYQAEISRRGWTTLASLPGSFNPDVVHQFYANALAGSSSSQAVRRSFVLGRPVSYDPATIRGVLDLLDALEEDELCQYHRLTQGEEHLLEDEILDSLCVKGWKGGQTAIYRAEMKSMTQAWLTFILANIMPSLHSSSLPTNKAILTFCIMEGLTVDVATIISDEIHRVAKDTNKAPLLFPSLINVLCLKQGVKVPGTPSTNIRPPITAQLLKKNCTNPLDEGQAPAPASSSSTSLQADLEILKTQQLALQQQIMELQTSHSRQMAAIFRGCQFIYRHVKEAFKSADHRWETERDFDTFCRWPEDMPISSEEEEEAASAKDEVNSSAEEDSETAASEAAQAVDEKKDSGDTAALESEDATEEFHTSDEG